MAPGEHSHHGEPVKVQGEDDLTNKPAPGVCQALPYLMYTLLTFLDILLHACAGSTSWNGAWHERWE